MELVSSKPNSSKSDSLSEISFWISFWDSLSVSLSIPVWVSLWDPVWLASSFSLSLFTGVFVGIFEFILSWEAGFVPKFVSTSSSLTCRELSSSWSLARKSPASTGWFLLSSKGTKRALPSSEIGFPT